MEKYKNILKNKGYCVFNLEEYDQNFLKYLEKIKCNSNKNIQNWMNHLRLDARTNRLDNKSIQINDAFPNFESAKNKVTEILNSNEIKELNQVWYFKPAFEIDEIDIEYIKNFLKKVVINLYEIESNIKVGVSIDFTFYDIGGMILPHKDAPENTSNRFCNILIYLNETYDDNDGGLLILDDNKNVSPLFGNVAILDLKKFNIKHEVTKVTNGIGRYALLAFITIEE